MLLPFFMLYHGSCKKITKLEPKPARGVGKAQDKLVAVYATHHKAFAQLFAIPLLPAETGSIRWKTVMQDEKICMILQEGKVDFNSTGYLYKFTDVGFRQIDELQWIRKTSVLVFNWEEVDPKKMRDRIIIHE